MDDAVINFRQAADSENQRRRLRRRYSPALRQQVLEYWQQRRRDESVRAIAPPLGVSVITLERWTRTAARRPRFRPIAVRHPAAASDPPGVVVRITPDGPLVEGLTVESAARLLTLLR